MQRGRALQNHQAETTKLLNLLFSQDAARRSQIKVIQSLSAGGRPQQQSTASNTDYEGYNG